MLGGDDVWHTRVSGRGLAAWLSRADGGVRRASLLEAWAVMLGVGRDAYWEGRLASRWVVEGVRPNVAVRGCNLQRVRSAQKHGRKRRGGRWELPLALLETS